MSPLIKRDRRTKVNKMKESDGKFWRPRKWSSGEFEREFKDH